MSGLSFRRRVGLAAVGALFLALLLPVAAQAATPAPPKCGGDTHCYVTTAQNWTTSTIHGMGGYFTEPSVMPDVKNGDYSIGQLALISGTSFFGKVIEFGWV